MSSLKPSTALERIAGSALSEGALTVVGAVLGGPLLPLLPILSKSLAAERQKGRVEAAISSIDAVLRQHEEQLKQLSDEQYKLVNETISAALQTTSVEKLIFLQHAVRNAMAMPDIGPQDAAVLSRVVRDISAEEATFVVCNFGYERIEWATTSEQQPHILTISPTEREGAVVAGLISLGLLVPAGSSIDDSGQLRFSPVVAKLITLLNVPAS